MRSALQSKWLEVSSLDTTLSFRNLGFGIALIVLMHVTLWAQNGGSEPDLSPVDGAPHAIHSANDSAIGDVQTSRRLSTPWAEVPDDELSLGEDPDNHLIVPFVKHLASDQRTFWTTPAHFRVKDLKWIGPFAGITAGF